MSGVAKPMYRGSRANRPQLPGHPSLFTVGWRELELCHHPPTVRCISISSWISQFFQSISALCGYPIGKMEIRDSSQISTTAPIFQQYNYFRQNLEENVTFTFYFFSFASNFPCKICDGQIHAWKNIGKYLYILNIKIHNEGLQP